MNPRRALLTVLLVIGTAACALADPFTLTVSMKAARSGHRATLLLDGRVLVTGGFGAEGKPVAAAETFDPRTAVWSAAASNQLGRSGHAAVRLPDGRVLVAGGATTRDGCSPNATAEIYDPAADAWALTGDLPFVAGRGVRAEAVAGGKVMLIGGDGCAADAAISAALFDPRANTWSSVAPTDALALLVEPVAPVTREGSAATRLSESTFLVTGGTFDSGAITPATEIVDLSGGAPVLVGPMTMARAGHSATRLINGTVLIAGGLAVTGPTAAAEIYLPEIAYQTSPYWTPRKYGPALAAASNTRDHIFALFPVQGPPRALVEYIQDEGARPDTWVPVQETVVETIGMPRAVRVDAQDNFWVVVNSITPDGVIKIDPNGHIAMTIEPANATLRSWMPVDVTWDGTGNVFVLDGLEGGVRKFDPGGRLLAATANTGAGALKNPHSIAADPSGNVYVADGAKARIQVFDSSLALKATYDTVGSPWALCISPGPHPYLYSGGANPDRNDASPRGLGVILKLELDGTIVGKIGRADNSLGVFKTPHHIGCSQPHELISFSKTDWDTTIRLQP